MLHEYCLNALVGLPCDPARTFRVAALVGLPCDPARTFRVAALVHTSP